MEAFTNGRVSVAAKRAYVEDNPAMAGAFTKVRGGYVMHAWESQIRFARAYGRGVHTGRGLELHPFDVAAG